MGSKNSLVVASLLFLVAMAMNYRVSNAQLSSLFYVTTCPTLENTVRTGIRQALQSETRMGASILRLFFHDCFVNGCDGSILLADTASFTGEQNALPNAGSARGYEVIDSIKAAVEASCPGIVSCADILAIAAKESVVQLGGPTWVVPLGRRDARSASKADAERDLPSPFANLADITAQFAAKNLSPRDMTALSGGHTLGSAQCFVFRARVHDPTANIDPAFAATRRATCPAAQGSGDANLAPFDTSAGRFDNAYYRDLVARRGLLTSDQVLFNNDSQDALVRSYSASSLLFFQDFAAAMVKMGNISPLTGSNVRTFAMWASSAMEAELEAVEGASR